MLFPLGNIYKIAKLSPHIMSKRMLEIAGRNTFLYYSVFHTEEKKKKVCPILKKTQFPVLQQQLHLNELGFCHWYYCYTQNLPFAQFSSLN